MKFFVTTPIYYVNDQPHIGHAYTSLAADVLSIYHRMLGDEVFFLTGTDEHGQKVQAAAEASSRTPKEHADLMVRNFQGLWDRLLLSNDFFIRTTEAGHKAVVAELLAKLWEKGEIVKRTYTGMYCTPCERFWTVKDLTAGNCPDCGRPVEEIKEDNYFFLMSRYAERLRQHLEDNPGYIMPEARRNEVLGFLKSHDLGDLCISRPKKRLSWGIALPFDQEFVTYVWFDALINYYSATRLHAGKPPEGGWWPANVHLIGKDILTTHAVYWSTMLMALGMPLPGTIFAHGWWTIEGRKMSKSLGNVINPADMVERYGLDAFRYFLFREVPFGLDGDFSEAALVSRINTDLANDFGNLASRTIKMAAKFFDSIIPEPAATAAPDAEMHALALAIPTAMRESLGRLQFQRALDETWKLLSYANKYIDTNAPWALAKDPALGARLRTVIYSALEALRVLSVALHPFMPGATDKLSRALTGGDVPRDGFEASMKWGGLRPGGRLSDLPALFPRIEVDKPKQENTRINKKDRKVQQKPEAAPDAPATQAEAKDNLIKIDDFAKVELKTALIKHAERVEGSDKLIRLEVDSGEQRQIVAGIGKAYAPEDLVGKTVIVVANLKPAKLMGVRSEGMLLAATNADGNPIILSPEAPVPPGVRVK